MEDQNFKFSVFGGFNKKSVVDYVTKIVNNFNLEIENLKKGYEKQIEQKNSEIADLSSSLQNSEGKFKKLNDELVELKNRKQSDDGILKQINEKDALILELREEIETLKKGSASIVNEKKILEDKVKKTRDAVKDRVNEIIEQARVKIAEEYRDKIEASKQEGKIIRSSAVKDASKILNNSASLAQKIVDDSKEKIKKFVELAKKEARSLVDSANLVGQKIIKKSAESVFNDRKNVVIDKLSLDDEISKIYSEVVGSDFSKINDELLGAVKKLNADFLIDEGPDVNKIELGSDGVENSGKLKNVFDDGILDCSKNFKE